MKSELLIKRKKQKKSISQVKLFYIELVRTLAVSEKAVAFLIAVVAVVVASAADA